VNEDTFVVVVACAGTYEPSVSSYMMYVQTFDAFIPAPVLLGEGFIPRRGTVPCGRADEVTASLTVTASRPEVKT